MRTTGRTTGATRIFHVVLSTTTLILPAVTLIPLGSLWLWEHGYILHWAALAFLLVAAMMALQWWMLRGPLPDADAALNGGRAFEAPAGDRKAAAERRLAAYVESLTAESLKGEQILSDLGIATIKLVASEMHPGDLQPQWNFTVPEALLVTERVAARLRPVVIANIPLGDRLTVRQVLRLYEWRGAVDWAERAYDVWRIVRLINPAAAITQEARERLTKKLYASLKDEFTVRLAQAYVREVGAAAIDLYSGTLSVSDQPQTHDDKAGGAPNSQRSASSSWSRLGTQAKSAGKFAVKSILRRK